MSDAIQASVDRASLDELLRKLSVFDEKIKFRIERTALRRVAMYGAKEVKAEAQKTFRNRTGSLLKAIKGGSKAMRSGGGVYGQIQVDPKVIFPLSYRHSVIPRYYAHLVEFGTKHSAPKPFMIETIYAKSAVIIPLLEAEILKAAQKEANKLGFNFD